MYTPNNLSIYLGALEGAIAGMAASDRTLTNDSPLSYATQVAVAGAFAQAVDGLVAPQPDPLPPYTGSVIGQLAYGAWQSRTPNITADNLLPSTYLPIAKALVALGTAVNAGLFADGINPGIASSMLPYPNALALANLIGDATLGNGTLTGFYKQDGDTLSIYVQLIAGNTTDYGSDSTLIVPLPTGYTVDATKMNPQAALPAPFSANGQGWPSGLSGIVAAAPATFPFLFLHLETAPAVFQNATLIPISGIATAGDSILYSVVGLPIVLV